MPNTAQAALIENTMHEYGSLVNAVVNYLNSINGVPKLMQERQERKEA